MHIGPSHRLLAYCKKQVAAIELILLMIMQIRPDTPMGVWTRDMLHKSQRIESGQGAYHTTYLPWMISSAIFSANISIAKS